MKLSTEIRTLTTATFAIFLIVAAPARAADVAKEIAAAKQHAGFAVAANNLAGVRAHLQHVINCLAGPKGEGFDANEFNPCKDLGNGVLIDFTGDAGARASLTAALKSAMTGVGTSREDAAKKAAGDTVDYLAKVK